MPESCSKILDAVNASGDSFESAQNFGSLKAGEPVGDIGVLFARIDEAKKLAEIEADKENA